MISKELIARYRDGIATREEEELLRHYFAQSNHQEVETFLNEEWESVSEDGAEDKLVKRRVWERLKHVAYNDDGVVLGSEQKKTQFALKWYWPVAGMAAAVVLMLIVANVFWKDNPTPKGNGVVFIERVNDTTEPMKIVLSDGSFLWLAYRSKIRYESPFPENQRKVDLDGEAYFEIVRDTLHPFTVHTRSLVVKVLGTSFTVNSFSKSKDSQVSVRSGKVAVSVPGQDSGIILLPNEKVAVSSKSELIKQLVESPVIVNSEEEGNPFEFSSTPIEEIFRELESAYQVSIKFDQKSLRNCTLTAKLRDQSLFTKLDIICTSIGGSYEVVGTQIVVKAPGCSDNS